MHYAKGLAFILLATLTLAARASEHDAVGPPVDLAKLPKVKLAANETVIYVADMHCAGCAKKVSSRLYRLKGVMKVRTDLKTDVAVVTPQAKKQIDPKAAWVAVQAAGKTPVKLMGPQGTFVADEKTKAPVKLAEKAETAASATTR